MSLPGWQSSDEHQFNAGNGNTTNAANENENPGNEAPRQPEALEIKFANANGDVISFKLKKTTPLKKAMDAYSARYEIQRQTLRFLFDGVRVQDDHTANSLEIEDGDTIEVHVEQLGGGAV